MAGNHQRVFATEICIPTETRYQRPDGSYAYRTTSERRASIVIEADFPAIYRRLARRAALSKGRVARGLGGAVVVRAINIVDSPVTSPEE